MGYISFTITLNNKLEESFSSVYLYVCLPCLVQEYQEVNLLCNMHVNIMQYLCLYHYACNTNACRMCLLCTVKMFLDQILFYKKEDCRVNLAVVPVLPITLMLFMQCILYTLQQEKGWVTSCHLFKTLFFFTYLFPLPSLSLSVVFLLDANFKKYLHCTSTLLCYVT